MAPNHLSLVDSEHGLEALHTVLRTYDFADSVVTRQQIGHHPGVECRVAGRVPGVLGDAATLGLEVTLEFDEAHYVGSGAFLMASVLERFLGLSSRSTPSARLVRSRQRERMMKRWPPRAGDRTLL
ncbi:MAG: type VI secretion system baseplate subunit TssF [Singulisphaera sp.]